MNINRLYEILALTTIQIRKGEELSINKAQIGQFTTIELNLNPSEEELLGAKLEIVDLVLLKVGVDKAAALAHRDELVALLRDYPDKVELAGGPSYIAVGATIGDQGAAFQLFAVGEVLGLWGVITPEMLGAKGDMALDLAGRGWVMITGFNE